jgi:GMP synthase-like glutamine amidotransferase
MRAHYLQHVPFEGTGSIEKWLDAAGYAISCTRLFESPIFPGIEEFDLLVIMGGPMSVNDESLFPWLVQEKQFIQNAIRAGKRVLGICLGAQLIANAMGSRVYPNGVKEIGWFPVQALDSGNVSVFRFPPSLKVFHWHGETFELPSGAVRLARSEACENQAFQLGTSVIGLQFHIEATPETALELILNCRSDLQPSEYVQSEEDIRDIDPGNYRAINSLMDELLAYLHRAGG